ncbi:FAD-dependent oxidoreductase [Dehalobacterium formicoaceticum]|uniref:FAD-dependent oxidoreductase n=1 Tax=Dehalobacterium formicoaceticum TaxID=51515 RepID=A0ABT1XZJ6_9FIRM|nr:FAD-dependent oxidoreductase [Dehalobacterium formicoaceticum]MCR6544041.1 FAD-dependent oxidoreductase [Dehalobacterium formicoaceticum]
MKKKVLIIGGVAGGATTAARLRRLDETAEIIILERGEYISYANCGLPYHIGDVIKERGSLLLQTPEAMKARFNIDVRVNNEALSIEKERKVVSVLDKKTGKEYEESYDTLLIATGSSPLKPSIPGIDGPGIYSLWTIPDTDKIKSFISTKKPKKAAIIGGGFIGLEMAENLHAAGCEVTVIEMQNQVMAPIDFEMAQLLHENMRMNQVQLVLNDGVKSFEGVDGTTIIQLQSGKAIEAELVILSIGIKPNSVLAKEAGLALNERGGVVVNEYLKTSEPSIYAVGDVIEVEDYISKNKTMVPLAGPANKQARICANNIAREFGVLGGDLEKYKGTQGTSIAKVFDLTVASTGVNEKTLKKWGKEFNKDYFVALINQKSHAGYYPGATPLTLKMLFSPEGKIFGAQIIGQDGVDKRIDTIAAAIRLGGTIYDLAELELAYAPPYSSAKDPVNMLGFVAENILNGLVSIVGWNGLEELKKSEDKNYTILDVSEDIERMAFFIPDSYHIPLGQLRNRLGELDKEKLIIVYCAIGVRAYNAARMMMNSGFKKVKIFPGGSSFYKSLYHDQLSDMTPTENKPQGVIDMSKVVAKQTLDCSGLQCPGPIMKVYETIKGMSDGEIIQVSATDMGFARDIDAWCKRTGNCLLKSERAGKENIVYIQKGRENTSAQPADLPKETQIVTELPQGKNIIVFSGDLDKVLAAFIIANGAAAMGRPVSMFFTFWGLNALRRPNKQNIKKPFLDSMFGAMMPRGASKLKLSKMNMGGMGTEMMKKVMRDKNVDSLEILMNQAIQNGVKLIACSMSMDIMGITKDELIDGIGYAGVATMLGDAEESNMSLFI